MVKPAIRHRLVIAAMASALAVILAIPLILRINHASIYADDVVRIGELQTSKSALQFLFAPFNEHMAPLFQAVTLTSWNLAGRSLILAPIALTLASFLPHVLCLLMLGLLVCRETNSRTTGLTALNLFGLSGLISETFSWYSASSFSWALLGTLAALECAGRAISASSKKQTAWLAAAAFASLAAPAFSAIGLLAGPLACVRLGLRLRFRSLAPLVGTLAYLAICLPFRYGAVVSHSMRSNLNLPAALQNAASAPVEVLLPGFLGVRNLTSQIPDPVAIIASLTMFAALLFWAWKDRSSRSLISLAIVLISGGYALAFAFRSSDSSASIRSVQRYQLFPIVGLVLLAAAAGRRLLLKWDDSAVQSWTVASISAAIVLALQLGLIREHAKFYRWPDQPQTLAAIGKLAETCEQNGITRHQCLAALDPVRNRWFDFEFNALILLPETSWSARRSDSEAREILLSALDITERESLFGGMDVSNHFIAANSFRPNGIPADSALVRSFGMSEADRPDFWTANSWGSFLEYEFSATAAENALAIAVPVNAPVEVWWSADGHKWSEAHSVRWRAERTTDPIDRVVFLASLPHWNPDQVRRIRIAPRASGTLAIGTPRLLR